MSVKIFQNGDLMAELHGFDDTREVLPFERLMIQERLSLVSYFNCFAMLRSSANFFSWLSAPPRWSRSKSGERVYLSDLGEHHMVKTYRTLRRPS